MEFRVTDDEKAYRLNRMSPEARHEKLEELFKRAATSTPRKANKKYISLFERPGLKDSPEIQETITRLGGEYLNLLLFRWEYYEKENKEKYERKMKEPESRAHHAQVANDFIRECAKWNAHTMQQLEQFPEELGMYAKTHHSNRHDATAGAEVNAVRMMGSIIKLSLETLPALAPDAGIGIDDNYSVDALAEQYFSQQVERNIVQANMIEDKENRTEALKGATQKARKSANLFREIMADELEAMAALHTRKSPLGR